MRPKLKRIEGERKTFTGTFARFGKKDRYRPKKVGDEWVTHDLTVLLVDVRDSDGNPVTDHLWFNYTKGFASLGDLQEGDVIRFDARVRPYIKGYVNQREYIDEREVDYKLDYPTKVARAR